MAGKPVLPDPAAETVSHPFVPICGASSRVLILGTMPSAASRRNGYYYGHPQNRFWPLLAYLYHTDIPRTDEARRDMILRHQLALWDVLKQCRIRGSADNSIQAEQVNPIGELLEQYPVEAVFANGQAAARLYRRYLEPVTHRPIQALPSTSPANARYTLADLAGHWQMILHPETTGPSGAARPAGTPDGPVF